MITYTHLVRHIVPGPQSITWFIPLLVLPIALLIPRTVLSRWQNIALFMPIITLSNVHAWMAMGTVDVITSNALLWSFFLLVVRDPWRDFRWVEVSSSKTVLTSEATDVSSGEGRRDDKAEPVTDGTQPLLPGKPTKADDVREVRYPADLRQRLSWVGLLLISIRMFGWRIGYPSHDRRQPPLPDFRGPGHFLLVSVPASIIAYLTLDLTYAYISTDEYFTNTALSLSFPFQDDVPRTLLRTGILGAQLLSFMGMMFFFPASLAVLVNLTGALPDFWSPHTWPTYLGSPGAIVQLGVRGWWGRFWHQTMRWTVSGPGIALSDAIGVRDRSVARFVLVNMVAFFLSGFIHMGLVPPEPQWATISGNAIRVCILGFFWSQAVGIMLEAMVAWLVVRLTGSRVWQAGGGWWLSAVAALGWVYLWFTLSSTLLFEAGRHLGWWRVWPVPVSFWRGLRGEGWLTWSVFTG